MARRGKPVDPGQMSLFADHAPYVRKSKTSKAAAKSVKPFLPTQRLLVVRTIEAQGERGLTCDGVEEITGLRHQACSARVLELREAGLIVDSGRTRKTRSGRQAVIYVVPEKEEAVAS